MENNPEQIKGKDYFLNLLKQEIITATIDGLDANIVYLHNDQELDSSGKLLTIAKYFNPKYDSESGDFTVIRLIPLPDGGEFSSRLEYKFNINSDCIYAQQCSHIGNLDGLDGHLSVREKIYTSADDVEYVCRCISDGLRLSEKDSFKLLRKHRKREKSAYGIYNDDIPSGKFMEMAKIIFNKIFHDI